MYISSINLLFGIILLWSISTSVLVLFQYRDIDTDGAESRLSPANLNKRGSSQNAIGRRRNLDKSGTKGAMRAQNDIQTTTNDQSTLHLTTHTNSTPEPIWKDAKTEADAAYLLSQGTWLHGSYHVPENTGDKEIQSIFLNKEELNFLKFSRTVTSKMTVETATTRVAFKLWGDVAPLYGTATSLSHVTNSEFFCRLSWGYHWCDPINHGIDYHSKRWSNARGVEILEIFMKLANAGRDSPSILFMGDSVMSETWQAGICSLARTNAEFLKCPESIVHSFPNVTSVCFKHKQMKGALGVLGLLADHSFDKNSWRNAVFGCTKDSKNCTADETIGSIGFNWDLVRNRHQTVLLKYIISICKLTFSHHYCEKILPNLGVHHNLGTLNEGEYFEEYSRYREYLTNLFEILLDHGDHERQTNNPFPALHLFWGTSPQVSCKSSTLSRAIHTSTFYWICHHLVSTFGDLLTDCLITIPAMKGALQFTHLTRHFSVTGEGLQLYGKWCSKNYSRESLNQVVNRRFWFQTIRATKRRKQFSTHLALPKC